MGIDSIVKRLRQLMWRRSYLLKEKLQPLDALWEQRHLKRFLAEYDVDCVFDVGANKGQYALMLRREVGYEGLIISFEPIPEARDVLSAFAEDDPQWVVEDVALSERNGRQSFNVMASNKFSSFHRPRHEEVEAFRDSNAVERVITVPTETLGSAYERLKARCQFERPFLKMDTQGHDVAIASHAADCLQQFVGMQSELSVKRLYEDCPDFREALAVYEDLGFELSALVPNNAGMFPLLVEVDCIMIRSDLACEN
jgi:FkbM family methyltransferase